MFTRLLLKLLFKVSMPLIAMVGIMSYMMYLQGGDPMAVLSKVSGGIVGKARTSISNAGDSIQALGSGSLEGFTPGAEPSTMTEVQKWVDEYGVTHYGNIAPDSFSSDTLRINPNANVVASVRDERPQVDSDGNRRDQYTNRPGEEAEEAGLFDVKGMTIPGSDMKMPTNLNAKELTEFIENSQRPTFERYSEQGGDY